MRIGAGRGQGGTGVQLQVVLASSSERYAGLGAWPDGGHSSGPESRKDRGGGGGGGGIARPHALTRWSCENFLRISEKVSR